MTKFNVGDRVRVITNIDESVFFGKGGIILEIDDERSWPVKIDLPSVDDRHTIWHYDELELVSPDTNAIQEHRFATLIVNDEFDFTRIVPKPGFEHFFVSSHDHSE